MIIVDVEQGSSEWWDARLGIPTASEFDKIITPAKLEASRSSTGYMHKLIAERLRGKPDEGFQSDWMKRGHEFESEAADYYAMINDCDPSKVGFCKDDTGWFGCSPDRLIDEDGGLEIKCPSPGVHVGYLLKKQLPTEYKLQVYGSILVTGREWWDFLSYHPDLQPFSIRIERKEVLSDLETIRSAIANFVRKLKTSLELFNKEAA